MVRTYVALTDADTRETAPSISSNCAWEQVKFVSGRDRIIDSCIETELAVGLIGSGRLWGAVGHR